MLRQLVTPFIIFSYFSIVISCSDSGDESKDLENVSDENQIQVDETALNDQLKRPGSTPNNNNNDVSSNNQSAGDGIQTDNLDLFVTVSNRVVKGGESLPYGEPVESLISSSVEIDESDAMSFIVDISDDQIVMSWSPNPEIDTLERTIEDGESEIYSFEFSEPILEGLTPTYDEGSSLKPTNIEVINLAKLEVEFGAGVKLSDESKTVINLK